MKFLVFATDLLPLPGTPTSGTALRTFGIVEGLRAAGHHVDVSVPRTAIEGFMKSFDIDSLPAETVAALQNYRDTAFDISTQHDVLNRCQPDVVICGHWPAMGLRVKPKQLLVVDLAGPHLLERHYQGSGDEFGATIAKLTVVATADYFIVSGPSQRLYFLSFLQRVGVKNPEQRMVTLPMPLAPRTWDEKQTDHTLYPHFLFGGVFLPWQDPSWGLRQLAAQIEEKQSGTLQLIGGKHPSYKINEGDYAALFAELGKNPRVKIQDLLPYDKFISEMEGADIAINLQKWNLERQLAVTIRSTTFLWSGLPLIYDDYSDVSSLIKKYNAGWCVNPGDEAGFRRIVNEIYSYPETVKRKAENAKRLAQEVFFWDKAVGNLLELLARPETTRGRETDLLIDAPENADLALTSTTPLTQYFVCRVPGLNRVDVRVATHNRELRSPVKMNLYRIKAAGRSLGNTHSLDKAQARKLHTQTREKIASAEISLDSRDNNGWISLETEAISSSAGETFLIQLESTETDSNRAIAPWATKCSPYPLMGLYQGERRLKDACLCMKTSCSG